MLLLQLQQQLLQLITIIIIKLFEATVPAGRGKEGKKSQITGRTMTSGCEKRKPEAVPPHLKEETVPEIAFSKIPTPIFERIYSWRIE